MKPTIESSLRQAIASLRVAQELTKGELDREQNADTCLDWRGVLHEIEFAIEDLHDALELKAAVGT